MSIHSPKDQHLIDLKDINDSNNLFEQKANEIVTNEQEMQDDLLVLSKNTIALKIFVSIFSFFFIIPSIVFFCMGKIFIGFIIDLISLIITLIILGSTTSKISFVKKIF